MSAAGTTGSSCEEIRNSHTQLREGIGGRHCCHWPPTAGTQDGDATCHRGTGFHHIADCPVSGQDLIFFPTLMMSQSDVSAYHVVVQVVNININININIVSNVVNIV